MLLHHSFKTRLFCVHTDKGGVLAFKGAHEIVDGLAGLGAENSILHCFDQEQLLDRRQIEPELSQRCEGEIKA